MVGGTIFESFFPFSLFPFLSFFLFLLPPYFLSLSFCLFFPLVLSYSLSLSSQRIVFAANFRAGRSLDDAMFAIEFQIWYSRNVFLKEKQTQQPQWLQPTKNQSGGGFERNIFLLRYKIQISNSSEL